MANPTGNEYRSDIGQLLGGLYRELVAQVAALEGNDAQYSSTNYSTMHSYLETARDAVFNALVTNNDSGNP